MTTLSIIVAVAKNLAIGKDNQLLWHIPEDLKYFKRVTMGKPLIMGRKTFESIGRPLPGRLNIVVTRQDKWESDGVKVARSINEAIALAKAQAEVDGVDEVMVIGGAEIYKSALAQASRIYLTKVDVEMEADTFFPTIDISQWTETSRESFTASDDNQFNYDFCVLDKIID